MRFVQKIDADKVAPLKPSKKKLDELGAYACIQVEDALAKRFWLDQIWRVCLRQYSGIPDTSSDRQRPYSESLVLEIPLGAKQCDTIVSAITELIFSTSPPVTIRGSAGYEDHGFAFQALANKILIDPFVNFRPAAVESIIDTVQMGTGVGCVSLSEEVSKSAIYRVVDRGPRVWSIPPENFIVPGGAYSDINSMPLVGYRTFYNQAELNEQAVQNDWDVSDFKCQGGIDWVRQRREQVAATSESTDNLGNLYEVYGLYAYYDLDNDGLAEDIYFVWDRASKKVGYVAYAPYDSRPFVISRYQTRPHVFYGLGVLEMSGPFQQEITEWHNFKLANAMLANSRMWAYRIGAAGINEEMKIGPNRMIGLTDPKNDLQALTMADVYQSAMQYEMQAIALSDQRVGVNELGGGPITAGKRVPAATAMSIMQQQNRRFAMPFNNMRDAVAELMSQCFQRMKEQYQKGAENRHDVMEYVNDACGIKYAHFVEELFAA